jgi:dCMP deaminase
MDKWDERWMKMAAEVATWSKDPSTQVGAIIANGKDFIMLGYNGFPPGVQDTEARLNDRNQKYPRIVHAEVNAIIRARQDVRGYTLYTYPFAPCSACTGIVIAAGISRVVAPVLSDDLRKRWGDSILIGEEMFKEAGVSFETF